MELEKKGHGLLRRTFAARLRGVHQSCMMQRSRRMTQYMMMSGEDLGINPLRINNSRSRCG